MIKYRTATIDDLDSLIKTRIDFLRYAKNIRNEDDVKVLIEANRTF